MNRWADDVMPCIGQNDAPNEKTGIDEMGYSRDSAAKQGVIPAMALEGWTRSRYGKRLAAAKRTSSRCSMNRWVDDVMPCIGQYAAPNEKTGIDEMGYSRDSAAKRGVIPAMALKGWTPKR